MSWLSDVDVALSLGVSFFAFIDCYRVYPIHGLTNLGFAKPSLGSWHSKIKLS